MEKGKRPDPTTNEKGKKKKERKGIKWNKGVLRSILFSFLRRSIQMYSYKQVGVQTGRIVSVSIFEN